MKCDVYSASLMRSNSVDRATVANVEVDSTKVRNFSLCAGAHLRNKQHLLVLSQPELMPMPFTTRPTTTKPRKSLCPTWTFGLCDRAEADKGVGV